MAEAAGLRVHRYTSPHLVRFHERIVINGNIIEDAYLLELLERVKLLSQEQPVTFFEATTAAAFLAFAQHPADVVLLETGMGGRLDATNVIARPLLAAITPVSIDHAEFLGEGIKAIAREKAGIVKNGVPCVVGPQLPEAQEVIESIAAERNSDLIQFKRDWDVDIDKECFYFSNKESKTRFDAPALAGRHQYYNAATAIACMRAVPQLGVTDEAINTGLKHAAWPARMQQLTEGDLVEIVRSGDALWLDGGHNPAAGEVIANWLENTAKTNVYVVCGMLKNKDERGFIAPFANRIRMLYAVDVPEEMMSKNATDVVESARALGVEAEASPDIQSAIRRIIARETAPVTVLVCGSLYLAGHVLRTNR